MEPNRPDDEPPPALGGVGEQERNPADGWRQSGKVPSRLAALVLGIAVVVIVMAPLLLATPNVLSMPSAAIVLLGCGGALVGGRSGRWTAIAVSAFGLILSGLWFWFARDGFGKGVAWWDDMVEAGILTALFLVAILLLLLVRGSEPTEGQLSS